MSANVPLKLAATLADVAVNGFNPKFWESHCHLDFSEFDADREQVINQAAQVGVNAIMIPGVTPDRFSQQLQVAATSPIITKKALGLHPWFIDPDKVEQQLATFDRLLLENGKLIDAIGECGLDFVKPHTELQMRVAEHQLRAAQLCANPVILHHRKSHDQLSKLLKYLPPSAGVVHGFSGSYQQASRYLDLGLHLGIGGTITYERSQKTRRVVQKLPLDCLVLETDAPAMPLYGKHGEPNQPKYIAEVFAALCELRSESPEQIAECLWRNTEQLFGG